MKKIISLLLCAAMLLICLSASAETEFAAVDFQARFQIKIPLFDGYRFSLTSQNDLTLEGTVSSEDTTKPFMVLYVSYNDSYADVKRLNDLGEAELEQIKLGFSEENNVSFDTAYTSLGTQLLVVREIGGDQDFLDFYTIYLGHEIELLMYAGPDAPDRAITDEQVKMCIDFLSEMDLVPVQ